MAIFTVSMNNTPQGGGATFNATTPPQNLKIPKLDLSVFSPVEKLEGCLRKCMEKIKSQKANLQLFNEVANNNQQMFTQIN